MSERPAFIHKISGTRSSEPFGGNASEPALRDRAVPASAGPNRFTAGWVPGEPGVWVFILGDMLMFGVFFAAFLVERSAEPELFAQSRQALATSVGAINTLVLLVSSLFVATAVRAYRGERLDDARRLTSLAGVCAALFAVIKVTEWVVKLSEGSTPGEGSMFFTYYYLLTGIHFLHLTIGGAVLALMWHRMKRSGDRQTVESCASYWHMVDLLWVVLFPVVYL